MERNETNGMANRTAFRKTWESSHFDDIGRPEATTWHHTLLCGGAISVQERLTGYGYWDVETGYASPCGQFWLASGGYDIRRRLREFDSEEEMIQWVIDRANNCTGGHHGRRVGSSLEWLTSRDNWRPRREWNLRDDIVQPDGSVAPIAALANIGGTHDD
jgi:hypothetical protein